MLITVYVYTHILTRAKTTPRSLCLCVGEDVEDLLSLDDVEAARDEYFTQFVPKHNAKDVFIMLVKEEDRGPVNHTSLSPAHACLLQQYGRISLSMLSTRFKM